MTNATTEFQKALSYHLSGKLAEAEALYRQLLSRDPRNASALHFYGVLAAQTNRLSMAAAMIGQSIEIDPNDAEAQNNLGAVLRDLKRLPEAVEACRKAISLRPKYAEAFLNLGNALRDLGRLHEALDSYREAAGSNPNLAQAHNYLGAVLMDLGSHAMAADAFRKAIALQPTYPEALNNLAHALKEMEELDAAVEYCRQAIEIAPRSARIWNNLGSIHKRRGEMDQAINAYREALRTEPSLSQAHSNLILCMQYHPGFDAPTIARELRAWNLQHAARFETQIIPHTNSRLPERTLKVGYVSPDFRDHVVGRNLLPLFKLHDRHDFEVYCYADSPSADGITAAFRRLSHKFRNTSALPDEAVASQIREDQIDILVDLALHTSPRLPLFARKPAPVQVAFAGYPGSTGLTTMDYRITDPYLDPPEQDSNLYAEEAIRLPHSFWCYDPMDAEDIPVGLVPALQNKHVTFGCLNSIFKINATTVERWCRVLRQVDGSKMVLMVPEGSARDWMRRQMASFGIDGQRIEFVPRQSRLAYLELFREIDISLDTFPYNGHTTSLDSLWMGVPLVTIIGNSSLGRAGWSVLSNLGLQELAGTTSDSFTQIAASLAADLPRLAHLRANLREMMRRSPLTNGGGFTEAIQTAYRVMWRRWCNAGVSRPTSD